MILALDNTMVTSSDPPDSEPVSFGTHISSGQPGHPSIDISPKHLTRLATGRTTHKQSGVNCWNMVYLLLDHLSMSTNLNLTTLYYAHTQLVYQVIFLVLMMVNLTSSCSTFMSSFHLFGQRMIDGYLMQLSERVP
jgi:hypothetical protein